MKTTTRLSLMMTAVVANAAIAGVWLSPSNQYCYTDAELEACGDYEGNGNVNTVTLNGYWCADSWTFHCDNPPTTAVVVSGGNHAWNNELRNYEYEFEMYGENSVECFTVEQLDTVGEYTASEDVREDVLEGYLCATSFEFESAHPESVFYASLEVSLDEWPPPSEE